MSIVMQINPFDFFTDTAGDALDAGYIYIGEPNKDPRQYPVVAYYDSALTIPAPMPLRTSGGYIARNGSPTFLYINGNYSIIVQDKNHRQIYYVPDFLLIGNDAAVSVGNLSNTTNLSLGAALVGRVIETFDSVAQMKTSSMLPGRLAHTNAYYAGWNAVSGTPQGSSLYAVLTPAQFNTMMGNASGPAARGNGGFNSTEYVTHTLANGNIAVPICDGKVRVTIAGARPGTHSTASQHNQLNAAHAFAWKMKSVSTMFNGGFSRGYTCVDYCGQIYYTNSTIYTVYDSDAVGSPDGGAGAQIEVCNGGLKASADWNAVSFREMLLMTDRQSIDWCQGMSVHHMVFDGSFLADVCVAAEQTISSSFYSNECTRYKTAGVETRAECFNFDVNDCLIEARPWPFPTAETNPFAGVYFQEVDNLVTNSTIIGNLNGIRCPRKTRIIGSHMYGNKYSMTSAENLIIFMGNYVEDPIRLTGGRDTTITGNFFSESIKGAAIIMLYDGLGTGTGSSITANIRAQFNHTITGNITLSATAGLITITSTANDFLTYTDNGHVDEGTIIKAGSGIGYIRNVLSPTSCTVAVTKAFNTTSYVAGTWVKEECLLAVFDAPEQSPIGAHFVGNRPGRNTTPDPAQHTAVNDGRQYNNSYEFYDWTQGDGKGDFWLGGNVFGMGMGVVTLGVNRGISSIWAKGDVEWLVFGGYTAGQLFRMTPDGIEPGADNTRTCGSAARRFSVVYAGTGAINTSDERSKQDIRQISEAEHRVALTIKGCMRAYRMRDAVEKKGDDARIHFGVIAQDVVNAFAAEGLDATRYGMLCHDVWEGTPAILNDEGIEVQAAEPAGDRYGVRYEELYAFLITTL